MSLTDVVVRNAKAQAKTTKLFDERGLYLEISPSGGKWWRLKYRIHGKEKRLSLGVYPDIKLKQARERRDELRRSVANGIDPSDQRKFARSTSSESAAHSFEVIAREWYEKFFAPATESHWSRLIQRLELYVFPFIGGRPIAEVTAPELMKFLSPIHNRDSLDTAHRVRGTCGQIFRYAVATGPCELDPTLSLRGALPPATESHFASTTDPKKLAEILTAIDGYIGTPTVRLALRLPRWCLFAQVSYARQNGRILIGRSRLVLQAFQEAPFQQRSA